MKKAPAVRAGAVAASDSTNCYRSTLNEAPAGGAARGEDSAAGGATHYLSGTQCAERRGIKPVTWRAYHARGQAPKPDAWIGDVPGWLPGTVDGWERPGQGARTDRGNAEPARLSRRS